MARRAAVLTVSDRASRAALTDTSGPAVAAMLAEAGFAVAGVDVLPDERAAIADWLRRRSRDHDLVVTTGGTGLAARDVTPEATADVLERDVPGLAELMRQAGLRSTPMAALSRSRAGIRGRALILNLPGSERGATESLAAVVPVLAHAVGLLAGGEPHS
ncbi:MAG: MogA/MoaB family molybdenum cofactor biosynthesis protein [Candidatus Dormibacteraeota bacterium]|nr:MogA/MoaB family molybdenum cofactor biosynthesis protein [Candidatus Dormibacteraeota bacterium]